MNAGMELMGMKECRECGDPYTPAEPDTGVCSCCIMSHEVAALRARVAELEEGNVRRQVALEARAETAERDLDIARGLIARLGDPDSLESHWVLLRHERARVAELERAQDAAFRDAHRAEADAARLREALEDIARVAYRGSAAASLARAALASAPNAEPTPRDMRVAEAVAREYERKLDLTGAGGLDIDLAAVVAKAVGT